MSEMVERVARAAMEVTKQYDCGELKLKHHYEIARAVIAAMRNPTHAMVEAMDDGNPCRTVGDLTRMYERAIDAATEPE